MSTKRSFGDIDDIDDIDNPCNSDKELDKILQERKLPKRKKDSFRGFCDICEKIKNVREDKEQPQFDICVDCEIDELVFMGENCLQIDETNINSKLPQLSPVSLINQHDDPDDANQHDDPDDANQHDDPDDADQHDDPDDRIDVDQHDDPDDANQHDADHYRHPTCWGCRSPYQPNQLAHMDPGGCLYNPSESSEDSEDSDLN
jgi:hypothetical protein